MSDLLRVHPGRPAALPTATGWDEELRARTAGVRLPRPGHSESSFRTDPSLTGVTSHRLDLGAGGGRDGFVTATVDVAWKSRVFAALFPHLLPVPGQRPRMRASLVLEPLAMANFLKNVEVTMARRVRAGLDGSRRVTTPSLGGSRLRQVSVSAQLGRRSVSRCMRDHCAARQ